MSKSSNARPIIHVTWEDWADRSLSLPFYATAGAAGADIRANLPIDTRETGVTLQPMERALIPTGIRIAIPAGFEVQVRPRSGLALKNGIGMPNSVGTIDSDYRGPLGVMLINLGTEPFVVRHGDRIAQMVVAPVVTADFAVLDHLDTTSRGNGGFGSTGTN